MTSKSIPAVRLVTAQTGASSSANELGMRPMQARAYVLRSRSDHPTIAANRNLIHKIGITGGSVEARIAGARDDATFLLSDVDVVATYKLYDVNRPKLEALIHRVLDAVRFDAAIPDRFGKPVRPKEWFMVPLPVVDDIVSRIGDGTLAGMIYDSKNAALIRAA